MQKHEKWIELIKQSPKVQDTNSVMKINELFSVCMEYLSSILPVKYWNDHASALYYITASKIYSNQDKVDDKVNVVLPSHKALKIH